MCGLPVVCVSWVRTQIAELLEEGRASKAAIPHAATWPAWLWMLSGPFVSCSHKSDHEAFLFKSLRRR